LSRLLASRTTGVFGSFLDFLEILQDGSPTCAALAGVIASNSTRTASSLFARPRPGPRSSLSSCHGNFVASFFTGTGPSNCAGLTADDITGIGTGFACGVASGLFASLLAGLFAGVRAGFASSSHDLLPRIIDLATSCGPACPPAASPIHCFSWLCAGNPPAEKHNEEPDRDFQRNAPDATR
jgi:hypothetical protein